MNVDGHRVAIGNRKLMEAEGVAVPAGVSEYALARERAGNTAVFAAVDGKIAGVEAVFVTVPYNMPSAW